MGFLGDYTKSPGLSRMAISYIYSSLKKRKLYSKFKRYYRPLNHMDQGQLDALNFVVGGKIYLSNGEETYIYNPSDKVDYNKMPFFKLRTVIAKMLGDSEIRNFTPTYDSVAPHKIMGYVSEDYFVEKAKKDKPKITDARFSIIFGLIFTALGVVAQILACYLIVPSILLEFIVFLSSITVCAFFLSLIILKNK